jgi:hypothetical protein
MKGVRREPGAGPAWRSDGAVTTTQMVLAGVSAGVVAVIVVWRLMGEARIRAAARSHLAGLRGRAGTARHLYDWARPGWGEELGEIMAAKLADLDRREAEVQTLSPRDPGLAEAADLLGGEYQSFGVLVKAVAECAEAAPEPRADLDDLLASPAGNTVPLAGRWRELEERRAAWMRRLRESSPDDWVKVGNIAKALAGDYRRLTQDVGKAWARQFPQRAAAREAEEKAVFRHILGDIKRRGRAAAPRRTDRPRAPGDDWSPDQP